MGKQIAITQKDLAQLRGLLATLRPDVTMKEVARVWGHHPATTAQFVRRLREGDTRLRTPQREILVGGPLRDIFSALDARGLSLQQQAKALGVTANSITRWRKGQSSPSWFIVECLAQLARVEIVVHKAKENAS